MLRDFIPRLYQQTILATAATSNCLVVLPTGLGKTGVALMLTVQRLTQYPNSKILMLAPTKPLCDQHVDTFRKHLELPEDKIVLFTGSVAPEKREVLWKEATITISTPQCITGESQIFTRCGPKNIKDFVESFPLKETIYGGGKCYSAEISEDIIGFDENKNCFLKATKCWKLPCSQIINIAAELGNKIKCTPEHPLLTINSNAQISWKHSSEIKPGDYIAIANKIDWDTFNYNLYNFFSKTKLRLCNPKIILDLYSKLKKKGMPRKKYYNYIKRSMPLTVFFSDSRKMDYVLPGELLITNRTGRSSPLKLPQTITPELCYLVGAMLGDGHIGNRGPEHGFEVVYSELSYSSIKRRFSDALFKTFYIKPSADNKQKGLIYYSSALAEVFEKLGVPKGKKASIINVPEWIYFCQEEYILAFLAGILNSDGDGHKNMLRICSVSKKFIYNLKWLLLRLGIIAYIEERKGKNNQICGHPAKSSMSYHLIISGEDNIEAILRCPLIDTKKFKYKQKTKHGTRSKDILPVKAALKKAYFEHRKNRGETIDEFRMAYRAGYLSKNYLKKNLPLLKSETAEKIMKIVHLPFRWVKVKWAQSESTEGFVYDLTIENKHNFIADGIINHNTVENDVINKRINLEEISLLIFDEAHHATKEYSYVWLAQQYEKLAKFPRILALTASPGSDMDKIKEICTNLLIEKVEVRTEKDADVQQYVQHIKVKWEEVEFPETFKAVQKFLQSCRKSKLEEVQKYGYCNSVNVSKGELLGIQGELQKKVSSGEKEFEALRSMSLVAEALKVEHGLELLETQGIKQLSSYLKNLQQEAPNSKTKAVKNLVMDENFKSAAYLAEQLDSENTPYPKLIKLKELVERELAAEPSSKIIIFTQFRNSAEEIVRALGEINVTTNIFVGQAKKNGVGFSQKQQKEILDRFRVGEFSVLVATSVAEEGLDIPKVDNVIFYEPIPSAIRSIQRRGRTGRLEKGEVTVLVTKGTRDEAYRWSSHHKEKRMYRNLETLKKEFGYSARETKIIANPLTTSPNLITSPNTTLTQFETKTAEPMVAVLADHREKNNRIVKELIDLNVSVKTAQLELADYLVSGRVAVELKTVPDFVASIIDGRLLEQVRDLKKNFERAVLVIEGEEDIYSVRKVHANAIRGMLSCIVLDFGVPVLYTKNPKDTAGLLAVMAQREQNKERDFSYHERKPHSLKEQQEFFVSSLPGIGVQTAKLLLEHFGSIKALVASNREELVAIKGVGDKTADRLISMFEEKYR